MIGVAAIWTPPKAVYLSTNFSFKSKIRTPKSGCISSENPLLVVAFPFLLSALPPPIKHYSKPLIASSAASAGFTGYVEEPATNVKFQTSLNLPGCSSSLSLLGTGFREKIFAIIGVKVYAAGLYVDLSALNELDAAKRKSAEEIQGDASFFDIIFQATLEKSLQIVLVRDVDGKTFWGALDDAISPRIKSPTPDDESAISNFRSIFLGRSLKKGTFVFLTWLDPTKMLVSVSSAGMPSGVDATIESENVSLALFDVFFGDGPVSPTLKDSVSKGLATAFK